METIKLKLGQEIKGNCPKCFGRGRKEHLEYNGDGEAICMVCSCVFNIEKYLNNKELKRGYKNGN